MEGQHLPSSIRPALHEPNAILAVRAWNLMGGAIDWAALEVIQELYGITDPELFIHHLAAIRDHQAAQE